MNRVGSFVSRIMEIGTANNATTKKPKFVVEEESEKSQSSQQHESQKMDSRSYLRQSQMTKRQVSEDSEGEEVDVVNDMEVEETVARDSGDESVSTDLKNVSDFYAIKRENGDHPPVSYKPEISPPSDKKCRGGITEVTEDLILAKTEKTILPDAHSPKEKKKKASKGKSSSSKTSSKNKDTEVTENKHTRKPKQREVKKPSNKKRPVSRSADALYNKIIKAQKDSGPQVSKIAIQRLVRDVARDVCYDVSETGLRFQREAFTRIQTAAEQFMHRIFRMGILLLQYKEKQTFNIHTLLLTMKLIQESNNTASANTFDDCIAKMEVKAKQEKERVKELYSKRKQSLPHKSTLNEKSMEFVFKK